jgi:hypothetical protein
MLPGKYFDKPTVTYTYRVTERSFIPIPPERFSLSYTAPGTEIIDILEQGRREGTITEEVLLREHRR